MTMEEEIEKWDLWFDLTGDGESLRAWRVAKLLYTKSNALIAWAHIIELNRLNRLQKDTEAKK